MALRSGHLASQLGSAFTIGAGFTSCMALLPVALQVQGWSAAQVGSVFFAINLPMGAVPFALPLIAARTGTQLLVTIGLVMLLVATGSLAVPVLARSAVALIALSLLALLAIYCAQPANNARAKAIGTHLTVGGTGTVTGLGRFFFSLGCAFGPYASLGLFSVATWAAWALVAAMAAVSLLLYPALGVSLFRDPSWPQNSAATLAVQRAATQRGSEDSSSTSEAQVRSACAASATATALARPPLSTDGITLEARPR